MRFIKIGSLDFIIESRGPIFIILIDLFFNIGVA